MYDNFKCFKFFVFLFSNKMLVIRAGTHKLHVIKANRFDPDQTTSSDAVCSGSAIFFLWFCVRQILLGILEH